MKKIFLLILLLFPVFIYSQDLENIRHIGLSGRNYSFYKGLEIPDTLLAKGEFLLPNIIATGGVTDSVLSKDPVTGTISLRPQGSAGGAGWDLTGNSGTTPGTDFVGTTDAQPLVLKSNNVQLLKLYDSFYRIDAGDPVLTNLMIGIGAGISSVSTEHSTFIGYNSGTSNTIGMWNTFVGDISGRDNVDGTQNTFIGHASGLNNISGINNTALGVNSFEFGTTGDGNTCLGHSAGRNLADDNCTIVGYSAALLATSANETDAFGNGSLAILTTGDKNTAVGRGSGSVITTGAENIFMGNYAAIGAATSSSRNVYIGSNCADGTATIRTNQIVIGANALGNQQGANVIALGERAGQTWKTTVAVSFANSVYFNGTASQANEVVFGGANYANGTIPYNNFYFNGRYNQVASLQAVTLQPNSVTDNSFSTATAANSIFGASVTDGSASGATMTIAGAQGTGTGVGGDIIFKIAPAGSTGNTNNALVELMRLKASGVLNFNLALVPDYADNAAATGAGLVAGDLYRTSIAGTSTLKIVE